MGQRDTVDLDGRGWASGWDTELTCKINKAMKVSGYEENGAKVKGKSAVGERNNTHTHTQRAERTGGQTKRQATIVTQGGARTSTVSLRLS